MITVETGMSYDDTKKILDETKKEILNKTLRKILKKDSDKKETDSSSKN